MKEVVIVESGFVVLGITVTGGIEGGLEVVGGLLVSSISLSELLGGEGIECQL